MNERQLRALFSVIQEPEANVIDVKNRENKQEVERIVRIFNITKAQHEEFTSRIKVVQNFKLVQSYN